MRHSRDLPMAAFIAKLTALALSDNYPLLCLLHALGV